STLTTPLLNVMIEMRSGVFICIRTNLSAAVNARNWSGGDVFTISKNRAISRRSSKRELPAGAGETVPGAAGWTGAAGGAAVGTAAGVSANFSKRNTLIVCGTLSSVTVKSFSVSPSIGLPSLSFTITVSTTNCVSTFIVNGVCGC